MARTSETTESPDGVEMARVIAVSGIDGAGKSSVAKSAVRKMQSLGYTARYSRPRYTCNEIVKDHCRARYGDPFAYATHLDPTLYLSSLALDWMAWNQTVARCTASLVFSDRHLLDVYAQAVSYGARLEVLDSALLQLMLPQTSFLLTIAPSRARARLERRRGGAHQLESLTELTRLAESYKVASTHLAWEAVAIDSDRPMEDVVGDVVAHVLRSCAR